MKDRVQQLDLPLPVKPKSDGLRELLRLRELLAASKSRRLDKARDTCTMLN